MDTIRLMADYQSWPLWWQAPHEPGDIDPRILPLSDETRDRLRKWSDAYDAILNWDDPASSGFATEAEEEAFEEEGEALWKQLQIELEGQYRVLYQGRHDREPRQPTYRSSRQAP